MMAPFAQRGTVTLAAVIGIVALLACPVDVASSPLEDSTLGGAVFTGPAHPHATALFVNPAALGLDAQGDHLYLDASLRLDQMDVQLDGEGSAMSPGVDAITLSPGGMLGAYWVGGKVAAGVALGVPMTEELIQDEESLGYHVLDGYHYRVGLTVAVSFRLSQRIYIGTGLTVSKTWLKLSFLRDTALEGGALGIEGDCNGESCGIGNADAAERYDVDVGTPGLVATQNLALTFGAVYQVAREWWLGLGIRSPSGFRSALALQGQADVTPAPRDRRGDDPQDVYQVSAEVVYKLPQSVALGLRGPLLPGWELVAGVRWQNYSSQNVLDLRMFGSEITPDTPEWYPRYRGLRDVVVLEAGLEGARGSKRRVGGRLRLESGATSSEALSPLQIAGPNASVIVGGELRLTNNLAISASYGLTWYPTTTVENSLFDPQDYVRCLESEFAIEQCTAVAEGRAGPSAAGSYGRLSHATRLSLRYDGL